ncbi:MAG TPA: GPW/gp25 family protein [Allosphingosinicella sp.]
MNGHAAFPYSIGANGQTARVSTPDYVEQLLEQIVFVEPGERVNRPDFGCSLRSLTFTNGKGEITTAVEALVQSALRQWVDPSIHVRSVDVHSSDGTVRVTISYMDARSQQAHKARLVW